MRDNEQILSLQLGDTVKHKLFYYHSKDPQLTLGMGKKYIASLLSQGVIFAGYNIKGFDTVMLKQFLGVEIPDSRLLDLCQSPRLTELTGKEKAPLEEACGKCGIDVNHKLTMNRRAEKYYDRQDIREQARAKAEDLERNKGWSSNFAFNYALRKIAGGHAIFDAYLEFVKSGGQKNTLFYEYAIGDVISEHQLLKALGY
jgi:hypothetical protein